MSAPENAGLRQGGEMADIGLRVALFLSLMVWGGWKLDLRWGCKPWLTLLGSFLGLGIGMYWMILRLKQVGEKGDS